MSYRNHYDKEGCSTHDGKSLDAGGLTILKNELNAAASGNSNEK
jgi:hypothetical protein